jgi:hypothetical protein
MGHKRSSTETDYGIEKNRPNGVTKGRSTKTEKSSGGGKASSSASGRTSFPPPVPSSSKNVKKAEKATSPAARRLQGLYNLLRSILQNVKHSVVGNPMAFLRTILFTLGILMALSRQDMRERIRRLTDSSWQKIRGTMCMGMKVSYI